MSCDHSQHGQEWKPNNAPGRSANPGTTTTSTPPMSSDFELDNLSNKSRATSTPPGASIDANLAPPQTDPQEVRESSSASWAWAASAMFVARHIISSDGHSDNPRPRSSLFVWSCALIFLPGVLLFAIGQSQRLTPLESFLALHFGLLLALSAAGLVVNVIRSRFISPSL